MTSLTDIIKKEWDFHWEAKSQEAFQRLKQLFIKEPILQMFDSRRLTVMKVNASDQVLDSILSQRDESENLHSVVFHSRKFTDLELNYEIHNKELLAIVKAFK